MDSICLWTCGPGDTYLEAAVRETGEEIQSAEVKMDFQERQFLRVGRDGEYDGYLRLISFECTATKAEHQGIQDKLDNIEERLRSDGFLPVRYIPDGVLFSPNCIKKDGQETWRVTIYTLNPEKEAIIEEHSKKS